MLHARRVVAATMLVACLCSCSGVVDSILAEHDDVTQGEFNGFKIGESKPAVLDHARSLNAFAIDASSPPDQASAPCRSTGVVFKLKDLTPAQTKVLMTCDLWSFETDQHPHGDFYELRFTADGLVEIKYMRPRIQVN